MNENTKNSSECHEQECSNCKRLIAVANLTTHAAVCHKHNRKCSQCDEIVGIQSYSLHKEFHTSVNCDLCGAVIEKRLLPTHSTEECILRLIECNYCQISFHHCDISSHIAICGSRTELCGKCNRYVKLIDKERHDEEACSYPLRPPTPENVRSDFPSEDGQPFMRTVAWEASPSMTDAGMIGQFLNMVLHPGHSDSPLRYSNIADHNSVEEEIIPDNLPEEYDDVELPCELCGTLIPAHSLNDHQKICELNDLYAGSAAVAGGSQRLPLSRILVMPFGCDCENCLRDHLSSDNDPYHVAENEPQNSKQFGNGNDSSRKKRDDHDDVD